MLVISLLAENVCMILSLALASGWGPSYASVTNHVAGHLLRVQSLGRWTVAGWSITIFRSTTLVYKNICQQQIILNWSNFLCNKHWKQKKHLLPFCRFVLVDCEINAIRVVCCRQCKKTFEFVIWISFKTNHTVSRFVLVVWNCQRQSFEISQKMSVCMCFVVLKSCTTKEVKCRVLFFVRRVAVHITYQFCICLSYK